MNLIMGITRLNNMKKIKTDYLDTIICPYCGHNSGTTRNYDSFDGSSICPKCNKKFKLELMFEPIYLTSKITSNKIIESDKIICPHCKNDLGDFVEFDAKESGKKNILICGKCNKKFRDYDNDWKYKYSTYKLNGGKTK